MTAPSTKKKIEKLAGWLDIQFDSPAVGNQVRVIGKYVEHLEELLTPKGDRMTNEYADRHPGVHNLMRWLTPNPNLPYDQARIAAECADLAHVLLRWIPDGPELTEALRKLLEAKDCFVRASFPEESR